MNVSTLYSKIFSNILLSQPIAFFYRIQEKSLLQHEDNGALIKSSRYSLGTMRKARLGTRIYLASVHCHLNASLRKAIKSISGSRWIRLVVQRLDGQRKE